MYETRDKTERTLRQRMRMYPNLATAANHPEPPLRRNRAEEDRRIDADRRRREDARRSAIISINGKDLSSEDKILHGKAAREARDKKAS